MREDSVRVEEATVWAGRISFILKEKEKQKKKMYLLLLYFLYVFLILFITDTLMQASQLASLQAYLKHRARACPVWISIDPPLSWSLLQGSHFKICLQQSRNQGIFFFLEAPLQWSILLYPSSSLLSEDYAASLWVNHLQIIPPPHTHTQTQGFCMVMELMQL